MVETIFSSALAQVALVFVLVFTVVFGALQKTKLFGDGKKQIDALVALVVGLIASSVAYSLDIIQRLVPFLAVSLVIILVFLVLVGFMFKEGEFKLPGWVMVSLPIIIFIAVVIAVLQITGTWDMLYGLFSGESGGTWITNVVLIVVLAGVVAAVVAGGGKKKDK